jgi:hypothetical protein
MATRMRVSEIPPEILLEIFSYLELEDVLKSSLVCHDWFTAINSCNGGNHCVLSRVFSYEQFESIIYKRVAKNRNTALTREQLQRIIFPPKYFSYSLIENEERCRSNVKFAANRENFMKQLRRWRRIMDTPLRRRNKLARFFHHAAHFVRHFGIGTQNALLVSYVLILTIKGLNGDFYDDNGEFILKLITWLYIVTLSLTKAVSASTSQLLTYLYNKLSLEKLNPYSHWFTTPICEQFYEFIGFTYAGLIILKISNHLVGNLDVKFLPTWKQIFIPWICAWLVMCFKIYNIAKGDKVSKQVSLITYVTLLLLGTGIAGLGMMKTLSRKYYQ